MFWLTAPAGLFFKPISILYHSWPISDQSGTSSPMDSGGNPSGLSGEYSGEALEGREQRGEQQV